MKTPDRSMDILLNSWLLYQTIACRVWARSAFYQASGAYGFRDQLQDGMSLARIEAGTDTGTSSSCSRAPVCRRRLSALVAACFRPGVRTRISDDPVWLPYAVAHYVGVTNDVAVLDESIPYLEGPVLRTGEHDSFFQPMVSGEEATLFEHCARALDRSLRAASTDCR